MFIKFIQPKYRTKLFHKFVSRFNFLIFLHSRKKKEESLQTQTRDFRNKEKELALTDESLKLTYLEEGVL
jgi:hypothetical protein